MRPHRGVSGVLETATPDLTGYTSRPMRPIRFRCWIVSVPVYHLLDNTLVGEMDDFRVYALFGTKKSPGTGTAHHHLMIASRTSGIACLLMLTRSEPVCGEAALHEVAVVVMRWVSGSDGAWVAVRRQLDSCYLIFYRYFMYEGRSIAT